MPSLPHASAVAFMRPIPLIECELLSPGLVFRRASVTRFRKQDRLERLEILDTAASPHGHTVGRILSYSHRDSRLMPDSFIESTK